LQKECLRVFSTTAFNHKFLAVLEKWMIVKLKITKVLQATEWFNILFLFRYVTYIGLIVESWRNHWSKYNRFHKINLYFLDNEFNTLPLTLFSNFVAQMVNGYVQKYHWKRGTEYRYLFSVQGNEINPLHTDYFPVKIKENVFNMRSEFSVMQIELFMDRQQKNNNRINFVGFEVLRTSYSIPFIALAFYILICSSATF
jgi:hypothetical protein